MTIDTARAWIAPATDPKQYVVRYEGQDYLVRIVPMAAMLFGGWRR